MNTRTHWTPSPEVRGSCELLGTELLFPTVADNDDDDLGSAPIVTTFGLWCVDIATGAERWVTAPFHVTSTYIDAGNFEWVAAAQEDGMVVMTLSYRGSYDHSYHLFTYDGATWRQVVSPQRVQQLALWEQEFRTWDAPGELSLDDFPLSGGSLASAGAPLTFAVDFTHAFSYDSGPMTPTAPEYEATQERSARCPAPGLRLGRIDLSRRRAVRACLPADHRAHTTDKRSFLFYELGDDLVVIDEDYRGRLHSVTVLEPGGAP